MKQMKKILALLLALMMLLSLCACGSAKSGTSQPVPAPAAYSEMAYTAYDEYAYPEEDMAAGDYETSVGFSAVNTAASAAKAESGAGTEAPAERPDKIIYSSDVTVETTDFDTTVGKISGMVEAYGGWIESSSVSGSNYYQKARGNASTRNASYRLRIPSSRFTEMMDSLSELGNVPYSHVYTENVTSQYYDAETRLKALKTQETRLLEMMELAETVEDVIIIEDRLTELRYQIESIQSRLNNWDRQVSYSTVELTVQEVREYTPEEKVNPSYGEELLQALKEGVKNAGEMVKNLLVFLVELIPILVILIPVVWLLVWLVRKLFGGSKARRAKRAEQKRLRQQEKLAKEQAKEEPVAPVIRENPATPAPAPDEPEKGPEDEAKPGDGEQ